MNKDLSYYERRISDEKAAAEAAADHRAKAAHVELARRYGERCTMLGASSDGEPDLTGLQDVDYLLRVS